MKLLKTKEVAEKLGICKDHFRKAVKHQPDFPKPILITPNARPQWDEADIEAFLAKKAA